MTRCRVRIRLSSLCFFLLSSSFLFRFRFCCVCFFVWLLLFVKYISSRAKLVYYTCQLFLRYKHEIFILGVLGFLKTTRSFPKIPEEVRSLPETSEDVRSLRTRINASSLPVLFTSKIGDREGGIVIYSFYTWFSFLTWV